MMQSNRPILSIHNIQVQYGAILALQGVSLSVYEKEIVALIGANGAGKTTLLMSLFSQPKISSGRIEYFDQSIHALASHDISKLGISLSPEGRRVFPHMTVEENLALGAISLNDKRQIADNTTRAYELFPILYERKSQRAGTLSGGEQQMLAIGRALMSNPKLLLLDEPSLGLAPKIIEHIFQTLKIINKQGTTILLVEQNAHAALKLANRGYVLKNGKITLEGSGKELLDNPEIQSAYLGG